MTKEELRAHCEKQVKMCEEWAKGNDREPSGKIYEEHKLILDLINELQDKSYELWKESYEEEHRRNIRLEEEIKALEQPSDDCVSRQAVLDLATTIQTDDYSGNEIIDVVEVDDIKALPPVTPTQSWIPVSERLPKESDGAVLISVDLEVKTGRYSEFSNTWYKGDMRGVGGDDPIAWQPLPQPYEEKRGNENGSN